MAAPGSMEGRPLVGWLGEVPAREDHEGAPGPVFVRREGIEVIVRQKDPCDPDPPRIPIYEGDQVREMTALSHTSFNTTDQIGDVAGLMVSMRIVPTRREPGRVYARTLRHGEYDDGRRVHVRPGESVTIEELVVELDHVDSQYEPTESGYVPLTPVLWT